VLGQVTKVLESGAYPNIKIDAAPLPSPNGDGGVPAGDGSLWISRASSPEKRAAAWQVIKYLTNTQQEAALALALGYAPIRRSATSLPSLQQAWANEPQFRTAYDQLTTGPESDATAGPLIGDYQGVRDAVKDGLVAMLTDGLTPQAALQEAERQANNAIQTYNARVSGG
jgi:sn-glycerol 3-phosphate transport system substrate-binding protein